MNIVPLFIFDRDEYAPRALSSLRTMVDGLDARIIVVDDRPHRLGFAGAIQEGWRRLLELDPAPDFVFHMEGDFLFNGRVDAARLAGILDRHEHLAQVSLKRQPWNGPERAVGGFVELDPDSYDQWADEHAYWVEHRKFFTTNPSVYRLGLCEKGWPQVPLSEGVFTHELLASHPHLRFAFYGQKYDAPLVEHIGTERAGHGY